MPHFEVYEATNGLKALNIIISRPVSFFAAVILDLNMPVMSGYDACDRIHDYLLAAERDVFSDDDKNRELLNRGRKTLIFSLSGDSSSDTYRLLRMHPFDDHLESLAPNELNRLVSKTRHN
jgi:CheY-like chemotaxis protein